MVVGSSIFFLSSLGSLLVSGFISVNLSSWVVILDLGGGLFDFLFLLDGSVNLFVVLGVVVPVSSVSVSSLGLSLVGVNNNRSSVELGSVEIDGGLSGIESSEFNVSESRKVRN